MDLPGAVSRRYDQGLFGMTRGVAFMDVHQNLVRFGWQPPSPNRPQWRRHKEDRPRGRSIYTPRRRSRGAKQRKKGLLNSEASSPWVRLAHWQPQPTAGAEREEGARLLFVSWWFVTDRPSAVLIDRLLPFLDARG